MSDPDWALSLTTLLDEAWRRLEAGTGAARHPVLATTGEGGPEVRTVVLRTADRKAGTLVIHSDAASPKVAQLRRRPRAALLVWDPEASLQIRLDARVSVTRGAAAAAAWANVPDAARRSYGGTVPGTSLAAPEDAREAPELERFAVLRAYVHRIELLHLGSRQRRALYLAGNGFAGRWIAP